MKYRYSILIILSFYVTNIFGQSNLFVNGYFKRNGTYIQPHYRTTPNGTLFDNYSTLGNYNPYTGKPGWIDPYERISKGYYSNMPVPYQKNYHDLFNYLSLNDSVRFFNFVNDFDNSYRLFFTGLFQINKNEIEAANKIFGTLAKDPGNSKFIYDESLSWLELTSNYLNATRDFSYVTKAIEYSKEYNYLAELETLSKIKDPLNYYYKYLFKFSAEYDMCRYVEAKNSFDSLLLYAPNTGEKDSLTKGREGIFYGIDRRIDYLKASQNLLYNYPINNLYNNLIHYIQMNNLPSGDLDRACFKIDADKCSKTDSVLSRSLIDTASFSTLKIDFLEFHKHLRANSGDTVVVVNLRFYDSLSFNLYEKMLSKNKHTRPATKSLVYKFENVIGNEYLISENIALGLIRKDKPSMPHFEIYVYGFINPEGISVLTPLFD